MNGIDIILLFELRNLELKHTYQTFEEEYSNNRKLLSRACLACLDIILHEYSCEYSDLKTYS